MDVKGRKLKKPPACVQCRRRKIGCDRGKPICGNCTRMGKTDCFYPDIPGQFVTSHSGSHHNGMTESHRSREIASMIQQNPELASMEQIREYNTRLQLLNAQERKNSPVPMESAKFIPRTATKFENKPVSSANDSPLPLNWVQGPAIYGSPRSQYISEEALIKEIEFTRSRLLELQEITGKKTDADLSWTEDVLQKKEELLQDGNDFNDGEGISQQKREQESGQEENSDSTDANESITFSTTSYIDEYKDLDPDFLDNEKVFTVFDANRDFNSNSIFNISYLRKCDLEIQRFYNRLDRVVEENFQKEKLKLLKEGALESRLGSPMGIDENKINFPSKNMAIAVINRYSGIAIESEALIPIMKPKELMAFIEQSFTSQDVNVFVVDKTNLGQLVTLGHVCICMLLMHECVSSSVLIHLKDDQTVIFQSVHQWLSILQNNLHVISEELNRRCDADNIIDVLKYVSLWKFYKSIRNSNYSRTIDLNQDMQLMKQLPMNSDLKTQTVANVMLFNFIYKNYLWRHLFIGEIPVLLPLHPNDYAWMMETNIANIGNTSPSNGGGQANNFITSSIGMIVMDPFLKNDYMLLNFQNTMVRYLHSKDRIISIPKIMDLKGIFQKLKTDEETQKSFNTPAVIHSIVDSIIYRNSMLYLNYYMLLEYDNKFQQEPNKEFINNFALVMDEFLKMLQESLFYIFANLANLKFAGYEFYYKKKSFMTLDNICHMILGILMRARRNGSSLSKTQADLYQLILKKILALVQDYSKNLRYISETISCLITKLQTIVQYTQLEEEETNEGESKDNIFGNMDQIKSQKHVQQLISISESLIKTDYYRQRQEKEPAAEHTPTLGISLQSFSKVYQSFYS